MTLEQIPVFVGSPYYELVVIVEKWGPLHVMGNISLYRMADYFLGVSKDGLVTKERPLAASVVAWPGAGPGATAPGVR